MNTIVFMIVYYKCKTSVSHKVSFPLWIYMYVSSMYTKNICLFDTMLESLCLI